MGTSRRALARPARLSPRLEESQAVSKPRNKESVVSELMSCTKKIKEEDGIECWARKQPGPPRGSSKATEAQEPGLENF